MSGLLKTYLGWGDIVDLPDPAVVAADPAVVAGVGAFWYAEDVDEFYVLSPSGTPGWILVNTGGGGSSGVMQVQHQETAGTNGGASTTATWTTRKLNVEVSNTIGGASLAANQIILPAGTYSIQAFAASYKSDQNKLRLRNITDGADLLIGLSYFTHSGASYSTTPLQGIFTLAGTKTLELQYFITTNPGAEGQGVAVSQGTEVYADVIIQEL